MIDTPPPILTDTRRIRLRRIKAGSLFKLIFIAGATTLCPFILFCGVLAFFGANTITVSGAHVTGLKGLVAAIIMAPLFVLIFSLFFWIAAYVGLRVFGYFKPITIEYVPAENA